MSASLTESIAQDSLPPSISVSAAVGSDAQHVVLPPAVHLTTATAAAAQPGPTDARVNQPVPPPPPSSASTSVAVTEAVLHGDVSLLAKRWRRTAVHCALIASRLFLIRIAFGVVKQLLKGHLVRDPRRFLTNCVLEVLSKNPVKWAAFGAGLASYRAWQETANALLDSICLRLLRWIDVMTSAQAAERMRVTMGGSGGGAAAPQIRTQTNGTDTLPNSVSPRGHNLRRTPPPTDTDGNGASGATAGDGAAAHDEAQQRQRMLLSPKAGATLMTASRSTDPAEQRSLQAMLRHVPTAGSTAADDCLISPPPCSSVADPSVTPPRSALATRRASHRRCVSFSAEVVTEAPATDGPRRGGLGALHPSASVNFDDQYLAPDGSDEEDESHPPPRMGRSASWVLLDSLPLRTGAAQDPYAVVGPAALTQRRREEYWAALAASPIFQQVQKVNRVLSSVAGAWFASAAARVFDAPTQVDLTMYLTARAAHCFMCSIVFPALPARVAQLDSRIWNPLAMMGIGASLLSHFVFDPDTHAPAYQRFLLQATMLRWGQIHSIVSMDRFTFDPSILDFAAQRGIAGIAPVASLAPAAAVAAADAAVAAASLVPSDITAQIAAAAAAKAVQPMFGLSGAAQCAIRHPGTPSCIVANTQYMLKHVFQMSMPLYLPLRLVSTLVFGRKQLLRAPVKTIRKMVVASLQSSLFLALYCGGPFSQHCLHNALGIRSRSLIVAGATLMTGVCLLLEPAGRQLDLVLFCGMHALRSTVMALYKKGVIRRPTMGDVELLNWLAWAGIFMTIDFCPGHMHANFLSTLRWLLGEKSGEKKAKGVKDRTAAAEAATAVPEENPEVVALEQAEIQAVGM